MTKKNINKYCYGEIEARYNIYYRKVKYGNLESSTYCKTSRSSKPSMQLRTANISFRSLLANPYM